MPAINSVLGPIDSETLGFTLMHEHPIHRAAAVTQDYPELLDAGFMESVVKGLLQVKEAGIDTIIDGTTLDLGRDVKAQAHVSRRSGVNIIACTGWWLREPFFLSGVSVDRIAAMFIREIREGIGGTNIKAGMLKGASDRSGVTEWQATVLRALARAHLETGVPIMLHSYSPGRVGEQQVAVLKEEGVDLSRVKVDHSNDTTDMEYLTGLLKQGCYLGMDRYPGRGDVGPLDRNKTMKSLIDAGYVDRILPSHDKPLARFIGESPVEGLGGGEGQTVNPDVYLYIKQEVFPSLREMEVSEAIIDRLCVAGPRNFFGGVQGE
ncbi:phosphotriesterase [Chloroflexota bacterium]